MRKFFVLSRLIIPIFFSLLLFFLLLIFEKKFAVATHDLIRTDNNAFVFGPPPPTGPWGFCLDGDLTADYTNGRYAVFPSHSTTGYTIGNSSLGGVQCGEGSTQVPFTQTPPTDELGTTVKLYATNPVHDSDPPIISNLTAGSITQTGATVTWTTNE